MLSPKRYILALISLHALGALPAGAQTPAKKPDAAWLTALAKDTCVAMLTEPAKAEAIGKGRGYEAENDGNLTFRGTDQGVRISILLVPLRNPNLPLTFRQCFIKLRDDRVETALLRREIEASFRGTTFREINAIAGLKAWDSNRHAVGDKEIIFHLIADSDGSNAGTTEGLQINRVK